MKIGNKIKHLEDIRKFLKETDSKKYCSDILTIDEIISDYKKIKETVNLIEYFLSYQ